LATQRGFSNNIEKEIQMSSLFCCFWWFVLGALAGWLASWLFGRAKTPLLPAAAVSPTVGTVDFAKARAAGFLVSGEDNLEIIEGIGPQIAKLLRAAGIDSFTKLAAAPVTRLQQVLSDAGPRFRLADPGTWPEQSKLAAENRWADLKALQDTLDIGVRRNG
jgi:predicted flap endonuclease-1-like 5' DNA nuclease